MRAISVKPLPAAGFQAIVGKYLLYFRCLFHEHTLHGMKKDATQGRPFDSWDQHIAQPNQSGSADFSGFLLSLAGFSVGSDFFSSSLDLEEDDRPCPDGDL